VFEPLFDFTAARRSCGLPQRYLYGDTLPSVM
jgi:hypothetical protein